MLLVLGSFAVGGTAFAAGPPRAPSRPHTYRVVLRISGDEYEDAQFNPLNGSDGTKCPPAQEVPAVKAKCWKWSAKHLGHGTYTQAFVSFMPDRVVSTFTLADSHGDMLTGNGVSPAPVPDPTPPHAIGHVNRFLDLTFTVTAGTGRFAGVNGALNGSLASRVVAVDAATGMAHKHATSRSAGALTFPSKL
jgi:hypothetical protein